MSADHLPPRYTSRLRHRKEVAERTWAFQFEKPSGFTFKAGQFTEVTLGSLKETGTEGTTHTFSIASAPHEDFVMVATRMRDTAFKRALAPLPLGTEVTISGASGDLVLHEDASRPAIMLAGGIGITPFRSIILDATQHKLPHRLLLLYSNRRPEDAPFLEELQALEQDHSNYRLIPTMTQMEDSRRP
jgi:ferredoxin-NADP reductase